MMADRQISTQTMGALLLTFLVIWLIMNRYVVLPFYLQVFAAALAFSIFLMSVLLDMQKELTEMAKNATC